MVYKDTQQTSNVLPSTSQFIAQLMHDVVIITERDGSLLAPFTTEEASKMASSLSHHRSQIPFKSVDLREDVNNGC
jgi:hypothetical protein